jgi:hypothetical protein
MKTVITAIAAITILATAASAKDVCMEAGELRSSLIDWYGERPVEGPSLDNMRLWVSDATGSWTLVKTVGDGDACVEAQGKNWNSNLNASDMMSAVEAARES